MAMPLQPEPEQPPPPPIEVLIITGLPGAGRTALLRELICTLPPSAATAVCVHHFAKAFGLETTCPLPASLDGGNGAVSHYSEVYDFGSGCICCSPDGDLVRVLREIAKPPAATPGSEDSRTRQPPRPTHLLIETTGLADPAPFVRVFAQPEHAATFKLRGVVAVLSAPELVLLHAAAGPVPGATAGGEGRGSSADDALVTPEAERRALQLEVADVVLLTKADLLGHSLDQALAADAEAAAVAEAERLVAAHCPPTTQLHPVALALQPRDQRAAAVLAEERQLAWPALEAMLPEAGAAACAVACAELSCTAADSSGASDGSFGDGFGTGGGMGSMGGFAMPTLNWGSGGHDSSFTTAVCVEDGAVLWPQAERWLEDLMSSGRVQRLKGTHGTCLLAIDEFRWVTPQRVETNPRWSAVK